MDLNLPAGWQARGALPDIEGDADIAEHADALEEDLIQISDPQGAFALDVGWYPAGQASGQFVCRLLEAKDWDTPVEEYFTRGLTDVAEWIHATVTQIASRLGEPAEFAPVRKVKIRVIRPAARLAPSLEEQSTGTTGPKPRLPVANVSHTATSFELTN